MGAVKLERVFADLHLHIGRTESGEPVKISGSRDLTFRNIAHEAAIRKGIGLLGVIDCHSPGVQKDIIRLLDSGEMAEVPGGGIRYRDTTILLGAEIEVRDEGCGPAHHLAYLPTLADMTQFTTWMACHMKNVNLSSQRLYVPARLLQEEVKSRGGLFIPAHIFTPHKSLFGSCSDQLDQTLDPALIDAVELGLSSDSRMAGLIPDL
ncbi:endonuclease Q family protein, partial [Paenibacillus sepulcri]|nr:endonuclease Q family protein [Paenibacillus sepulcri]